MKITLFSVALTSLFSIAFSALLLVPYEEGKPGHCFYEETGAMTNGEEKNIPQMCARAYCAANRMIEISTCGVIGGVNLTDYDYSKPYPKCCPQPV